MKFQKCHLFPLFTTGALLVVLSSSGVRAQTLEQAFIFGSRLLSCETPNEPGTLYTVVHHAANNDASIEALRYDEGRGWGYEILYSLDGFGGMPPGVTPPEDADLLPIVPPYAGLGNFVIFGAFDNSENGRGAFPDNTCPTEIYDSFIGAKNFLAECSEFTVGDRETPCAEAGITPDGIIFRVNVPVGTYRFVAAVGSADNPHAHRIVAENGGSGPPAEIGPDHVVLVSNYDQAEYGTGVYARVGFGCFLPPEGNGPAFQNIDIDGLVTDGPVESPNLEVTQADDLPDGMGYIRIHQLQANSNDGAASGRDANGGDMVLLELWQVEEDIPPGSFVTVERNIDPDDYIPGELVTVTLDVTGITGGSVTLTETIPAGFTVEDNGGGQLAGDTLTFDVTADGMIAYTLRAPDSCGTVAISGSGNSETACSVAVTGEMAIRCEGALSIQGGVLSQLIIGPLNLDPLDPSAPAGGVDCRPIDGFDPADPNCDDNGRLATTDYILDTFLDVGESNLTAAEGDQIVPDFALECGVQIATNPDINPDGVDGTLTVWRANADSTGLIDHNLAENVGDPVDFYVIYSQVYLDNTTGDCLPVILEIGSDDAVKVILNGSVVHVNPICRGFGAYGAGDRVPVSLSPGKNSLLIAVVERGGGTGVRVVVRDTNDAPLIDGSVLTSLEPPAEIPSAGFTVTRDIDPDGFHGTDEDVTVTLTATGITESTTITETIPPNYSVVSAGGGMEAGDTLTFTVTADGSVSYTIAATEGCDCSSSLSGAVLAGSGCGSVTGESTLACAAQGREDCPDVGPDPGDAFLEMAFVFGELQFFDCFSPNDDSVPFTQVLQTSPAEIAYQIDRGWGYDPVYPDPLDRPFNRGDRPYGEFGTMDDSPNTRGQFPLDGSCAEEIYGSFIGAKDFTATCNAAIVDPPDGDLPCAEGGLVPEGIIFRVDVPPGSYRFVGAFGDADNVHAHRILAENGGSGPPSEIGPDHVVLIENFDQAQQPFGQATPAEPGEGVFGAVGFGPFYPPTGDGVEPDPKFVNHDENGLPTSACPNSPTLEVTENGEGESYIRIHQLQGNSNDGCGGPRDPNGGDIVYLEVWSVGEGPQPGPVFRRGDTDANGALEVTDPINSLSFQFLGTFDPPCRDAADFDDNGKIEITDPIANLSHQFLGQAPPPAPGKENCGGDPTPDDANGNGITGEPDDELGCAQYPAIGAPPQAACAR